MATDPILENYLATLERILQPLSVSERAEIVTEIKSHVLEALERGDPKPTLQSVLQSLGPPEQVANRYLMERKVSMAKPPIHSAVKWLFAGCFGAFALLIIVAGLVAWKAMDLAEKLDEENLSVKIDDKGIHVRGPDDSKLDKSNFKVGLTPSQLRNQEIKTELTLPPEAKTLSVDFKLGEVRFENSESEKSISIDCTVANELAGWKPELKLTSATEASLNLDSNIGVDCTLKIPKVDELKVDGGIGEIKILQPLYSVNARINSGEIAIAPATDRRYKYDLNVGIGAVEGEFPSAANPEFTITSKVAMGAIRHE